MDEQHFEVFGRRLAALTRRNPGGLKVLALHGWLDNAASYLPLSAELDDYDLVALDMAGHGQSDHRGADGEYNIWNDLPDIEAVTDALGWEQFNLVGHSRGAVVSCLYAATRPERIRRLVLLDGIAAHAADPAASVDQLAAFLRDKKRLLDRPGRVIPDIDTAVELRQQNGMGLSPVAARLITERGLRQVEGGWCWSHDARLQGASAFKLTAAHLETVMGGLSMPVLLLLAQQGFGAREAVIPSVPDSMTIEEVAGGHHCHMDEAVEDIARRLRDFLALEAKA